MFRRFAPFLLLFAAVSTLAAASSVSADSSAGDPPDVAAIIDEISGALIDDYIFAETAWKMDAHLRERLAAGAYEGMDLPTLTGQLTADLQEVSKDLHLSIHPLPPSDLNSEQEVDQELMRARYLAAARRDNFGFRKVEIMPGNVGYLDLRGFYDAAHGGETAVAAMRFLSKSDALIVDLRRNGGGSPSMIQLLTSYFFEEKRHLNSFEIRRDDTVEQFWTQAHVEGEKMVDTPIWVLTSGRTFSAAEEFTYNLKNMERATIVGETTGGGAHPVDNYSFPEAGVRMNLPYGRAVNPITGTNWEGSGIAPHVEVEADQALDKAYAAALDKLSSEAEDPDHQASLQWVLDGLQAKANPLQVAEEALRDYVGQYGPRRIWLEDGVLHYRRGEGAISKLSPLAEDSFSLDRYDSFRIRFERDESGKVVTLIGMYDDGGESPNPRTE